MPLIDFFNPYAHAMRLRRIAYRQGWLQSYHAGVPVISVGNITLGGSGKSPLVLLIVEYLEQKHGKRVAIVSRGYKRRSKGFVLVRNGAEILASVNASGDEPQMFAERSPDTIVIVDEDRSRGAQKAEELGAEVIVLDDGFQHLRLQRDLDILLLGGRVSPVLPLGNAREPQSAIQAATMAIRVAHNDNGNLIDDGGVAQAVIRSVPMNLLSLKAEEFSLTVLQRTRVLALSSIASPERFHRMLRDLGAEVIPHSLGDHAEYSETIVEGVLAEAVSRDVKMIITTAKDIVKSRMFFTQRALSIPVLILSPTFEFLRGEDRFYSAIDTIL